MAISEKSRGILLPVILVMSLLLNACSQKTSADNTDDQRLTTKITASVTSTIEIAATPTFQITSIPTLLPTAPSITTDQVVGIIIFSMGDGVHQHLFIYQPNYLPISRITNGEWDDSNPAISPDGNSLAFTSNRTGQWDIYLWNLVDNDLQQITNTPQFESDLDWSPDNQWITYGANSKGQSDIIIRSITDLSSAPIQLTEGLGNNINPSWSALGRQIAFSTNRNGHYEIWLAQLDNAEDRFSKVAGGDEADYIEPAWSPDGLTLAWEKQQGTSTIQTLTNKEEGNTTVSLTSGRLPFWSPDGKSILARIDTPNQYFLTGYASDTGLIKYPMIALPARTNQLQWAGGKSYQNMVEILATIEKSEQSPSCQPLLSSKSNSEGRFSLVPLNSIKVENPYLSDMADECFSLLRQSIAKSLGWDLLETLHSAALPVTTSPDPGISQNWLYTGRAIALNLSPFDAGWMAVSREDFDGQPYWRLWGKCLNQDGACGQIINSPTWDFSSRASGDLAAFEAGGKLLAPPQGYWVDLTDIALQLGWERIPSQSDWRTYYPGIQFNTLVYSQGKSWQQAMLELYPDDIVDSLEAGK